MMRYDWTALIVWACLIFACLTLWTLFGRAVGLL